LEKIEIKMDDDIKKELNFIGNELMQLNQNIINLIYIYCDINNKPLNSYNYTTGDYKFDKEVKNGR
jgi:hypothetical protein